MNNKEIEKNENDEQKYIKYEEKTIEELEEFIKQNDPFAMYELGERYRLGLDLKSLRIPKDDEKAFMLFKKSKEILVQQNYFDDGRTTNCLGRIYYSLSFKHVSNTHERISYLKKAISFLSFSRILYENSYKKTRNDCYYEEHKNIDTTLELMKFIISELEEQKNGSIQTENLGNSDAMYNLGRMYEEGYGVEKDLRKAKELYEKSAKIGSEKAIKKLEELKQLMEKDEQKYIKYEEKTIEELEEFVKQNDPFAMYELGERYRLGLDLKSLRIPKDDEKAFMLFKKSKEILVQQNYFDDGRTTNCLGRIYYSLSFKYVSNLHERISYLKQANSFLSFSRILYENSYKKTRNDYYYEEHKNIDAILGQIKLIISELEEKKNGSIQQDEFCISQNNNAKKINKN